MKIPLRQALIAQKGEIPAAKTKSVPFGNGSGRTTDVNLFEDQKKHDGGMTKQMIYHGDFGWSLDLGYRP